MNPFDAKRGAWHRRGDLELGCYQERQAIGVAGHWSLSYSCTRPSPVIEEHSHARHDVCESGMKDDRQDWPA